MRTHFITGCATGFGRGLAEHLLERGDRVVATDPDPTSLADLACERALLLPLDVRDAAQVQAAARTAIAWSPPDVLVNNGGYAIFGTQEEADLEAIRDLFDVNVLGAGRVTQALLPTLRERSGTVVQLASVAGRTAFPESGWYAATKHAIEAMSEALYQEVCTFGMRVRLIEPGSFDTCFLSTALASSLPRDPASPYAELQELWDLRKTEALVPPQHRAGVVRAIVESLDDPRPYLHVPVGPDSERILATREALGPTRWGVLQGARNGAPDPDVFDPAHVLGADPSELGEVRAAWRNGQLGHWATLPDGPEALARLARLDG